MNKNIKKLINKDKLVSVSHIAKKWRLSERSVRNYCACGKVIGARIVGKTWFIPIDSKKPLRKKRIIFTKKSLIDIMKKEKESSLEGRLYHYVQINLTYNSNHIEGSKLTHDETRYIFETNTIGLEKKAENVDDIIETVNHFRCIDLIIDMAKYKISESLIKQLHLLLKSGTSDSRKSWFSVGDYKKLENEVGGFGTTKPKDVHKELSALIDKYNAKKNIIFDDIIDFHYRFERIHPFQDGNGRIGRLIMFKECLKNNIVPFIIEDEMKMYYYRGLKEWPKIKGYLLDTCLSAQDKFKLILDKFNIKY